MYNLDAKPKFLLSVESDAKTVKGNKQGYLTAIMYLAPHKLSGRNVCSHASAGCISACLNTAGHGGMALDENGLNRVQVARIQRTRYFTRDRQAFMVDLAVEIEAFIRRAAKRKLIPAIRLNGTSDLPWENIRCGGHPNIFAMFPDIQFYDYTKMPIRLRRNVAAIPNYHLTFSLSESNDAAAIGALLAGVNVAVAMNVKRSGLLPKNFTLSNGNPDGDIHAYVIDGDESDLRFLDGRGVIVGLRAKGRGRSDASGFIRNPNPSREATIAHFA